MKILSSLYCGVLKHSILFSQQQENDARKARGEPPLPEEDLSKVFRSVLPPNRLEHLLTTGQIATFCDHLTEYASSSFSKLFIAESVQKQSTEE